MPVKGYNVVKYGGFNEKYLQQHVISVSYTHLTLPTILRV